MRLLKLGQTFMNIPHIKQRLESKSIFLADDTICHKTAVIGYEKKFRWKWIATQMNTFVVAADFGDETITVEKLAAFLKESFDYAKKNYTGWPRGLQSGMAVIAILISENIEEDAAQYCTELKAGKQFAGFSVPVVINSQSNEIFKFEKNPIWGGIYYPHFKAIIDELMA